MKTLLLLLALVAYGHAACDSCMDAYNACSSTCYDNKAWYPICAQVDSPNPDSAPNYIPSKKLFTSYCDMNCWLSSFKDYGSIAGTQVLWHQIGLDQNGCKYTIEETRYAFSYGKQKAFSKVPTFVANKMNAGMNPKKPYDDMYLEELDCMHCDEVMKSPEPLLPSDPDPSTWQEAVPIYPGASGSAPGKTGQMPGQGNGVDNSNGAMGAPASATSI